MNLYLISRPDGCDGCNYDEYSDAVVCAASEDEARRIHPHDGSLIDDGPSVEDPYYGAGLWPVRPEELNVQYLGVADAALSRGVICASFHAG